MTATLNRDIAYREFGDPDAATVLICIPGILENQHSFDDLVPFIEQHEGCKLITVDLCGRGASDWLRKGHEYKMSLYLQDLTVLINHLHATHVRQIRRMHLLGTSMGGILAMHLAANKALRIKGLILNDVALTISWKSIYKLYGKLDPKAAKTKMATLAKSKNLDPRLLSDIQLPGHIDLNYRFNLRGIHFHRLLTDFEGPMLLLRGENSEICTLLDQIEFVQYANRGKAIEVEGESHPVTYKPEVMRAIANFLLLQKTTFTLCDTEFGLDHQRLRSFKRLRL